MDTEKVTNKYGSYTDYDCYNVFNDDVVNGIISNNNGYTYYSSAYYAGDKKQQKSLYQQDVEFL